MVGCLEVLASGTAIARMASEAVAAGRSPALRLAETAGDLTAAEVDQAADAGDPTALEIFGAASHYLGVGLANYINIFNPEAIVVGGGVTRIGHQLLEAAFALAKSRAFRLPSAQGPPAGPPSKADPRCSASRPSHATASGLGYTIPRGGTTADHTHSTRTRRRPVPRRGRPPHGEDERDAQTSQGPRPLDRRQERPGAPASRPPSRRARLAYQTCWNAPSFVGAG